MFLFRIHPGGSHPRIRAAAAAVKSLMYLKIALRI
jgi:hypothetical protein